MTRTLQETPTSVAKRLSEVLLCFPSAAAGGVRWQTLVAKYNERHSTTLDISEFGFSTPLAAASTLLWDVAHVVDSTDPSNPVVVVEDAVALLTSHTGRSLYPAAWIALYKLLCEIISEKGFKDEEYTDDNKDVYAVLVAQLKPALLEKQIEFDERKMNYFDEQGSFQKVQKMKHLLNGLVKWRNKHWSGMQPRGRHSELDEALRPQLEVVSSKKYHDLVLRCLSPVSSSSPSESPSSHASSDSSAAPGIAQATDPVHQVASVSPSIPADTQGCEALILQQQLEDLRKENARLRTRNIMLEQQVNPTGSMLEQQGILTVQPYFEPAKSEDESVQQALDEVLPKGVFDIPLELLPDILNDPCEPPPVYLCYGKMSCGSTAVPSGIASSLGSGTPVAARSIADPSFTMAPATWVWDGQTGHVRSWTPMRYVVGDHGLHDVPSGVVQQGVTKFESHAVTPSLFTMGDRDPMR